MILRHLLCSVQILLTVTRGSHISVWRVEVGSRVAGGGEYPFGLINGDVGFGVFVTVAGRQLEADGVVVVSSRHLPNQPGVLQVVVVVVVEVVLDEVVVVVVVVVVVEVVSSKQPHQPGVLQVEVRVRVLVVDDFADEVVVVMELLES